MNKTVVKFEKLNDDKIKIFFSDNSFKIIDKDLLEKYIKNNRMGFVMPKE